MIPMKRLLICLLFGLFFSCSAAGQSLLQLPLDFEAEEMLLEQALYKLSEEKGVRFSFTNQLLPEKKVEVAIQGGTVRDALQAMLRDTPLEYRELGAQIVIYLPAGLDYTISGIIRDAKTGERLINANVLEKKSGRGSVTNEYGYYSLTVPAGPVELVLSYVGYEPLPLKFYLSENKRMDHDLSADLTLEPIEVISARSMSGSGISQPDGSLTLQSDEVEQLPALAGEPDLIRSMYLLPGVQTGTDGIGGLHVRGGGNGQNLIMLDGVPVYNINHAAGLFSVFNTNAIRTAKLYKGGFPARYGGRLSSVLDLRTKEGNRKHFGAEGDVGLLSTRLTVEGPIVKNKSSFILSGRRSLLGWYLGPLTENLRGENGRSDLLDYDFYDFNGKLNFELSSEDNLFLSYYRGRDEFQDSGARVDTLFARDQSVPSPVFYRSEQAYNNRLSWGNEVASARWTHLFGDKLFGSLTASYSGLEMDISYQEADSLQAIASGSVKEQTLTLGYYVSEVDDFGLRLDFDYRAFPAYQLRFGLSALHHHFKPGVLVDSVLQKGDSLTRLLELPQQSYRSAEYGLYLENEVDIGSHWSMNAGLHLAAFQLPGRIYWSPQPRFRLVWQASPDWSVEAHLSKMAQFTHLLHNTTVGLPTDVWVPSTESLRPAETWQAGARLSWGLSPTWQLTADIYGKRLSHLLSFSEGASLVNDWETNVTSGSGQAYGLELMVEKRLGNTKGWASYTLGWANRQFNRLNAGEPFPYRFDRRHSFSLSLQHQFKEWLQLAATYVFRTGFAFSLPASQADIPLPNNGPVNVVSFEGRNSLRMPYYHRLDVGLNFRFEAKSSVHLLKIGVYNAYNRHNPLYYDLRSSFVQNGDDIEQENRFVSVGLLPLLPSLNYSIKF